MTFKFPAATSLRCCSRQPRWLRSASAPRRPTPKRTEIRRAAEIRRPRPSLLRSERSQRGLSAGPDAASTSPSAPGSMPASKCCRATASSWTTRFRRNRVSIVRARKQQPPDRPPAAEPAVGYRRLSAGLPAVLMADPMSSRRRRGLVNAVVCLRRSEPQSEYTDKHRWLWVTALAMTTNYPCSACNSFRIASPICVVLTAVVPSDLMSAVRRPLASTAAIAGSTLSASAPMSNE